MTPPPSSIDDLIALNQEILAIARARTPIAAELVAAAQQMPGRAAVLAELIAKELDEGKTLDQAILGQQRRLPGFYAAVVAAGVRSGRLTAALEAVNQTLARVQGLRRRVLGSLSYPLLIVSLAWVMAVIAGHTLLPMFNWAFDDHSDTAANLPALTGWFWVQLLSVPLLLAALLTAASIRASRACRSFTTGIWLADWIPGVRPICRWSAWANFARLLGLLVGHRTPLPEALRLAGDAIDWPRLSDAAGSLASEIETGRQLEESSDSLHRLPPLVRLAMQTGADQQSLAALLAQASESYHRRALGALNNLGLVLPTVATAVIGGSAVGAYALVMLGPYFQMLSRLSLP